MADDSAPLAVALSRLRSGLVPIVAVCRSTTTERSPSWWWYQQCYLPRMRPDELGHHDRPPSARLRDPFQRAEFDPVSEILAEELPKNAPAQFEEARNAAHEEVDLLIPRIPTVTITTSGAPGEPFDGPVVTDPFADADSS